MLSLLDTWDYSMNGLVSVSKENIGAVRTILHGLEENKYLLRTRYQNNKGQFQYEYAIYEYPYTEIPYTVSPNTKDHTQINTNIINTKELDKIDKQFNPLVNELIDKGFINSSDLDMRKYSDLFNFLLSNYSYQKVIMSTNYTIKRWKDNKELDENGQVIEKFFRKLLLIGNDITKEGTVKEVKDYYDNNDFNKHDVKDIAKNTTKEDDLYKYVGIEKNRSYEKDDHEITL